MVDESSGAYVYAVQRADGSLAPTGARVGRGARPAAASASVKLPAPPADAHAFPAGAKRPRLTKHADGRPAMLKNLMIPIRFSNHHARSIPSRDQSAAARKTPPARERERGRALLGRGSAVDRPAR